MRKRIILSLLPAALGIVCRLLSLKASVKQMVGKSQGGATRLPRSAALVPMKEDVVLRRYLIYFVMPLWFVPGILDYLWHRETKIETTSGLKESVIHSVMMTEVGLPIVAGLVLEINSGVLALMLAAFVIHGLTAIWDVSFAVTRRLVRPREQHTHSLLEMLPFAAISFAICLHWDQFLALFGKGSEQPRFKLEWKNPPLPVGYLAGILGAIGVFIVVPYAEELARCWQAEQRGLVGSDTPDCAPKLFGEA